MIFLIKCESEYVLRVEFILIWDILVLNGNQSGMLPGVRAKNTKDPKQFSQKVQDTICIEGHKTGNRVKTTESLLANLNVLSFHEVKVWEQLDHLKLQSVRLYRNIFL